MNALKKGLFRNGCITAGLILGLGAAVPALAAADSATTASVTPCASQQFTQPFLSWGDRAQYTLVPGQTADDFAATGWQLTGGARIVTAKLHDGTSGQVLLLPAGATAISPAMCVRNDYPDARALLKSSTGLGGISLATSYQDTTGRWVRPAANGVGSGRAGRWTLSPHLRIRDQRFKTDTAVRFVLSAKGPAKAAYEVYDLYVDPRMKY